ERLRSFKGCVFDMDQTLLGTERENQFGWYVMIYVLQQFARLDLGLGRELEPADMQFVMAKNRDECRRLAKEKFGPEFPYDLLKDTRTKLCERFSQTYGAVVMQGVVELLELLKKRRIRCAVATSSDSKAAARLLELAGISDFFEAVIGGDQFTNSKPHPESFEKACDALGLEPGFVLGFEDTSVGAKASYSAGLMTFLVPGLLAPEPDDEKRALIAGTMLEIRDLLDFFLPS
ncbi:MAG TPA: HAD family phosphatase, partial [Oligoflexia bacterium]|nr:HAD family phosphatase [Oligoflexia bacterium]